MIKSPKNAVWNAGNDSQGLAKRVLCVCSAGLLRSPTLANVLHSEYKHNTRAVGSLQSFALIPVSDALIGWANEIVFVDQDSYDELTDEAKIYIQFRVELKKCIVKILNISDNYDYGEAFLISSIKRQYSEFDDEL